MALTSSPSNATSEKAVSAGCPATPSANMSSTVRASSKSERAWRRAAITVPETSSDGGSMVGCLAVEVSAMVDVLLHGFEVVGCREGACRRSLQEPTRAGHREVPTEAGLADRKIEQLPGGHVHDGRMRSHVLRQAPASASEQREQHR